VISHKKITDIVEDISSIRFLEFRLIFMRHKKELMAEEAYSPAIILL
jgi:hypothetical protein